MKKFFLFFVIGSLSLFSHDDEHFLRGNEYIKTGAWDDAINEYQLINTKTPAIWCNMSLCADQKGDLFDAYVYALRACKDTAFLLHIKLADIIQKGDEKYQNSSIGVIETLFDIIQKWCARVDLLILQLLFLLFWIAFCLGINKKGYFRSYIVLAGLCAGLIFIAAGIFVKYKNQQIIGLINQDGATLYVGPHEQYQLIKTIQKGRKVTVLETRDGWIKIRNEKEGGWICENMLAIV